MARNRYCVTLSENKYARVRARLYRRYGFNCHICGLPVKRVKKNARHANLLASTIDHIIPRALGGGSVIFNLRIAHALCNSKRQHHDITQELREECKQAVEMEYARQAMSKEQAASGRGEE